MGIVTLINTVPHEPGLMLKLFVGQLTEAIWLASVALNNKLFFSTMSVSLVWDVQYMVYGLGAITTETLLIGRGATAPSLVIRK